MRACDRVSRWLMSVGLRILMLRNLVEAAAEELDEQFDEIAAAERRARVVAGLVVGREAEPLTRGFHGLGRAARAGLQAARRARDVPLFDLPEKVFQQQLNP